MSDLIVKAAVKGRASRYNVSSDLHGTFNEAVIEGLENGAERAEVHDWKTAHLCDR